MSLASRFFGADDDQPDPTEVALPLSFDDALEMVCVPRRRWILREMVTRDAGGGVELADLVRARASIELDRPPEGLNSEDMKTVHVGFYQTHLPRLAEYGLVRYDQSAGVIRSTRATHEAVAFIDVIATMADESGGDSKRRSEGGEGA